MDAPAGPIGSTHIYRFRSYRDAARNLASDRKLLKSSPGLIFSHTVYTGSKASECMQPGIIEPRRHMSWCLWENEQALEDFKARSAIGRRWQEQTDEYCELLLAPFRSVGTYRGHQPLPDLDVPKPDDGPVAVWTFANMATRHLLTFYDGIARSTKRLLPAPGLICAIAGPERLFHGATTFTVWESLQDMTAFSYRDQPHKQIIKDARDHNQLIDSMFIRFTPYRLLGDWHPTSRFAPRYAALRDSLDRRPSAVTA